MVYQFEQKSLICMKNDKTNHQMSSKCHPLPTVYNTGCLLKNRGYKTIGDTLEFRRVMKRCTCQSFWKTIPHTNNLQYDLPKIITLVLSLLANHLSPMTNITEFYGRLWLIWSVSREKKMKLTQSYENFQFLESKATTQNVHKKVR